MQKFYVGIAKVRYTYVAKDLTIKSDDHCGVFLIEACMEEVQAFIVLRDSRKYMTTPQKVVYA